MFVSIESSFLAWIITWFGYVFNLPSFFVSQMFSPVVAKHCSFHTDIIPSAFNECYWRAFFHCQNSQIMNSIKLFPLNGGIGIFEWLKSIDPSSWSVKQSISWWKYSGEIADSHSVDWNRDHLIIMNDSVVWKTFKSVEINHTTSLLHATVCKLKLLVKFKAISIWHQLVLTIKLGELNFLSYIWYWVSTSEECIISVIFPGFKCFDVIIINIKK